MKKLSALLLSVIMIFSLAVPAFTVSALDGKSEYPVIYLFGTGASIYDENGNQVYDFDYETDALVKDIVEICVPHLITGMATGDFDAYYDTLYNKMSAVYGDAKLDENGNPTAGTNVSEEMLAINERDMHKGPQDSYAMHNYTFWYDWRLDPMELADRLNEYIEATIENSGKDKVSLYGRCMGGTPIIAYLAKYGNERIDTICLDAVVTNGSELIGDTFTANIFIDNDALLRFANGFYKEDVIDALGDSLIFDILFSTLKVLHSVGVTDEALNLFMTKIIDKIGEGFISSYMRASYGTWLSYWTMVKPCDLERAKTVIFGEKGSETREKFAGLISKIDYYHETVVDKIPEILTAAKENGTKVCIISKYGAQIYPFVGSYNKLSDQWISVGNSSMGATTCLIGEALPESYIEARNAQGKGKYISPDKQIDASTCVLPDNTWFVKGLNHTEWEIEYFSYAVCSGDITDIDSNPDYPQFLCYDRESKSLVPMTKDNMNCEEYFDTDTGSTENLPEKESFKVKIKNLIELFVNFFKYVFKILGGK